MIDLSVPVSLRAVVGAEHASPEAVRALRAWHRRHDARHSAYVAHGGAEGREWSQRVGAELDSAVTLRAVPYLAHPVVDSPWGAAFAEKRLAHWAGVDVENPPASAWHKYAEGFALIEGDGTKRADYKLPHHDVENGKLVTNKRGVAAAIAALHGGRGGVDASEADKQAALRHLEQHRAEWETTTRCPAEAITLSAGAEPLATSVNQIARVGKFNGHSAGPFEFSPDVFDRIISNFEATQNQAIPVDYEHATEMTDGSVFQHGAPAVGWITDLDNRGADGLWGTFEWVDPEAVSQIRSGQYRYLSPAVVFEATHPETGQSIGPRLTSAALTNRPFLDGMAPLTASDPAVATTTEHPAEAKHLASLEPSDVHVPGAVTTTPQPKDKPMADEMSAASKHLRNLAAKLGVACADGAEPDGDEMMKALEDLMSQHAALKAASEKRMADDAEQVVEQRIRDRVIASSAKADAIAVYLADPARFGRLFPAPVSAEPTRDAALMSDRISPRGGAAPERVAAFVAARDPREHSKKADARARVLMSEDKSISYEDALIRASRELSKADRDATIARIGG